MRNHMCCQYLRSLETLFPFLDLGPPRCHVPGLISAILHGDNTSTDTTDKGIGKVGGKSSALKTYSKTMY